MKRFYILLISLMLSFSPAIYAAKVIAPKDCQTLTLLRKQIDTLDKEIVDLIGQRLTYVRKAGELKKNRKSIHDCARENEILEQVRIHAEKQGYPGSIAVEIYRTLLSQSNTYEKKYHTFHN